VRGAAQEAEVAAAVQLGIGGEHGRRLRTLCTIFPTHDGSTNMKTIAASEARKSFASVIDEAAREPIVIQRQQRNVAVVLSMQEYERLQQLNRAEFQRFCDAVGQRAKAAGLTEKRLAKLLDDGPDA